MTRRSPVLQCRRLQQEETVRKVALAVVLVLSRVQLGSSFSIGPQAKTLVTHGLCSKIPHPMFTILDIALLGVVIAHRLPWLLGAWLALVAIHALASKREARVLENAFGDAYREYRTRTWW
jgi:protein-S-isoprenylcysteine O-methyltransferase Ste14